jgi:RNA polymerase sigma-70 factor, ECF subfamily
MLRAAPGSFAMNAQAEALEEPGRSRVWTFDAAYQQYAPFMWRAACRLGVPASAVEDVVQDAFLVVHRRLPEFEERTSIRAWLFAILVRVVRDHRRAARRKGGGATVDADAAALVDTSTPSPLESTERNEAVRELYRILDAMEDGRRDVFVLVELEGLTVPEASHALSANVNTVYWRLRSARRDFEKILGRRRTQDERTQFR